MLGVHAQSLPRGDAEEIGIEPIYLIEEAGSGRVEYVDWPAEKKAIDIGSFYADSSKFKGRTGWAPTVSLRDGLRQALAFYRRHYRRYVDTPLMPETA